MSRSDPGGHLSEGVDRPAGDYPTGCSRRDGSEPVPTTNVEGETWSWSVHFALCNLAEFANRVGIPKQPQAIGQAVAVGEWSIVQPMEALTLVVGDTEPTGHMGATVVLPTAIGPISSMIILRPLVQAEDA